MLYCAALGESFGSLVQAGLSGLLIGNTLWIYQMHVSHQNIFLQPHGSRTRLPDALDAEHCMLRV